MRGGSHLFMIVTRPTRGGARCVVLSLARQDNIVCFCAVQKAHIADGFSAVAWVKHVAAALNAKAGGKPDFAQAKFKGMAGNPAPVLDAANAFLSQ